MKLTARQTEVLAYVKGYVMEKGYSPSMKDVASHFKFKSVNAAQEHVDALVVKGSLARTSGVARSLRVIEAAA